MRKRAYTAIRASKSQRCMHSAERRSPRIRKQTPLWCPREHNTRLHDHSTFPANISAVTDAVGSYDICRSSKHQIDLGLGCFVYVYTWRMGLNRKKIKSCCSRDSCNSAQWNKESGRKQTCLVRSRGAPHAHNPFLHSSLCASIY